MAWQCPLCQKTFAKENQHHLCTTVEVATVFENKAPHLPEIFDDLLAGVSTFATASVTTSTKAITLYGPAHKSFLIIQPKRKWMDIWFPLDRKVEEFPIFRIQRPSKSRYAHYVRLESNEDIVRAVLNWIAEAYQLTNQ